MNIKLFLKGLLLYTTILVCVLMVMCIDSLYDKGYFAGTIIVAAGLVYWCRKIITEEEFNTLSFDNFIKRHKL